MNYYEVLEISEDASDVEVHSAYRKMMKKWHPDINHAPNAEEMSKLINQAYDTLSNASERKDYDASLHSAEEEDDSLNYAFTPKNDTSEEYYDEDDEDEEWEYEYEPKPLPWIVNIFVYVFLALVQLIDKVFVLVTSLLSIILDLLSFVGKNILKIAIFVSIAIIAIEYIRTKSADTDLYLMLAVINAGIALAFIFLTLLRTMMDRINIRFEIWNIQLGTIRRAHTPKFVDILKFLLVLVVIFGIVWAIGYYHYQVNILEYIIDFITHWKNEIIRVFTK